MSQPLDLNQLAQQIKQWGTELGFQQVGITDTDLSASEPKLQAWLDKQYHGEMAWMARHGMMRARPHELQPGTLRVISVRMNYLPANAAFARTLKDPRWVTLAVTPSDGTITSYYVIA
ncbi:Epoxyqueuosine (oQ) reductase QueG [Klebsiella michiganensis]|nr:Epoxyqueuosine (oQ) reductase QueG [Klebsiella michiganensis]